ncbi:unnamed protein product [Caenorhabditis sp. 36 PRJEB53466]|nr:unnamed protein product [Caenorhabditis sp. 36 PRJEB53466]
MEKAVFMELAALHEPNGLFPDPERLAQSRQAFANIHNNWPGRCDESPLQNHRRQPGAQRKCGAGFPLISPGGDQSFSLRFSAKNWVISDKTASQLLRESIRQAQLRSDIVCHQLANFELQTLETLGMNALLEYKLDENREEDPRVPRKTLKHIDKYKIQMTGVLDAALYHTFLDISSTCVSDITCISRFRNLEVLIMYYLNILKSDVTERLSNLTKFQRAGCGFQYFLRVLRRDKHGGGDDLQGLPQIHENRVCLQQKNHLNLLSRNGADQKKNINLAMEDEFSTNRHGRACICMHSRKPPQLVKRQYSVAPRSEHGQLRSGAHEPSQPTHALHHLDPLFLIFMEDVITAMFVKLLSDILLFCNPILLKLLIQFTEQLERPMWQGFTCLTAAVYPKTLRLSNAACREKTVGEIVNFMAIDIDRFQQITSQTMHGVAVMVLLFPFNFVITMIIRKWQLSQMYYKDERTKMMN